MTVTASCHAQGANPDHLEAAAISQAAAFFGCQPHLVRVEDWFAYPLINGAGNVIRWEANIDCTLQEDS